MSILPRTDLVALILAAGGGPVIPARLDWLLHQPFAELTSTQSSRLVAAFGPLRESRDTELGRRFDAVDDSWWRAVDDGLLTAEGCGLLARWRCRDEDLVSRRRQLLELDADLVALLTQLGKRWATLSTTVLKNLDTAASSWASTHEGDIELPTVRQPALFALR